MPKGFYKDVVDFLNANGCQQLRKGKGSHAIWTSPHSDTPFTVPRKILSRHTANKIMKDAGIDHKF